MPHANASAISTNRSGSASGPYRKDLMGAYLDRLTATGRGNISFERAARAFLRRWPDPQAWAGQRLEARLSANSGTRPFITYLMVHQGLRPGYDYLLERKFASIWREINDSWLQPEIDRFLQ